MLLNYLLYLPIIGIPLLIFLWLDIKGKAKIALPSLAVLLAYFAVIGYLFGIIPYTPLWFMLLSVLAILINMYLGSADKILLVGALFVVPSTIIWIILGIASGLFMLDNYVYSKHGAYKFSRIVSTKQVPRRMKDGSIRLIPANKVLYAPYLMIGLLITIALAGTYAGVMLSLTNVPYGYVPLCVNSTVQNTNLTLYCYTATNLKSMGYNVSSLLYQNGVYYQPLYYNTTAIGALNGRG